MKTHIIKSQSIVLEKFWERAQCFWGKSVMNEMYKLKQLILNSEDLSKPYHYFFDLMDENKIMSIQGHHKIENLETNKEILPIIGILQNEICNRFGIKSKEFTPIFLKVPEYHFIHGICSFKGFLNPIGLIYFSDVKTGIFSIVSIKTDFIRFSLIDLPETQTIH